MRRIDLIRPIRPITLIDVPTLSRAIVLSAKDSF